MAKVNGTPLGAVKSDAYYDIPLDLIIVEDQIRSGIDMEKEAFLALMESIREKGVLEPVIVTPMGDMYRLISGERRFLSCRQLGLPTIPARVLDAVAAKEEIIALQLTENLQRENLDPMDEANALYAYMKSRHPGMDLDAVMNGLISYNRDQNRVENDFATTVVAINKLSGKSVTSLHRAFTLLKLPGEIQTAVKEGTITVSQGYIFAANLDSPGLMRIFNDALNKPMTNNALTMAFVAAAQADKAKTAKQPQPVQRLRNNIKSVRTIIDLQVSKLAPKEMTDLLADLESLAQLVRQEMDRQANEAMQISAKKEAAAQVKAAAAAEKKRVQEAAAAAAATSAPDAASTSAATPAQQATEQTQERAAQTPPGETTTPEAAQPAGDVAEPPVTEAAPASKTKAKTAAKKKATTKKKKVLL
jgi:ParB-like chromosome segregation protein Spo0J